MPTPPPTSFSAATETLESVLQRFRNDNLPLEDAIALFEEGVGALNVCQTTLQQARGKVEVLLTSISDSTTGKATTEPFDV
ncbi:MAG: exodeoxyribonuclease VII small subunit [Vampirovibrionales bacterium]|nr:exodeoxyribonuclease VII small subunit [Vampirovibrionales bacterium]